MLTRFVVAQMRKPRSRASWHRWYAVYRSLPHWHLLRWRVRQRYGHHVHAHHRHYRTLGHEQIGRDVVGVSRERHAEIHGRHS